MSEEEAAAEAPPAEEVAAPEDAAEVCAPERTLFSACGDELFWCCVVKMEWGSGEGGVVQLVLRRKDPRTRGYFRLYSS